MECGYNFGLRVDKDTSRETVRGDVDATGNDKRRGLGTEPVHERHSDLVSALADEDKNHRHI